MGDEAFAGYDNYRNMAWLERLKQVWPLAMARLLGAFPYQFAGALWEGGQVRSANERNVS